MACQRSFCIAILYSVNMLWLQEGSCWTSFMAPSYSKISRLGVISDKAEVRPSFSRGGDQIKGELKYRGHFLDSGIYHPDGISEVNIQPEDISNQKRFLHRGGEQRPLNPSPEPENFESDELHLINQNNAPAYSNIQNEKSLDYVPSIVHRSGPFANRRWKQNTLKGTAMELGRNKNTPQKYHQLRPSASYHYHPYKAQSKMEPIGVVEYDHAPEEYDHHDEHDHKHDEHDYKHEEHGYKHSEHDEEHKEHDYKHDEHDNDEHDYDHLHDFHIEHYETEKPTEKTTEKPTEPPPAAYLFNFYHIGYKLFFVPLYAGIIFIVFVLYLVLRDISRHKVLDPYNFLTNTGRKIRPSLDHTTSRVMRALEKAEYQYRT